MGKGFNNYMCKKFFHPGSRDNLKRVWMAQQKTEADKKKQEELKMQYEKEQELYVNKSMVSKESKEKLSVNFLYEPPPGMKKEREKEDGEPEYKFEWQRKYNAPREDYCRDNEDIRDQPFGIAVRNVRCIKCHKWGHVNTDRECPLFNKAREEEDELTTVDPNAKLLKDMKESGLAMTRGALNTLEQMQIPMAGGSKEAKTEEATEVSDSDLAFLKSLSVKDKKKLLRKLEKMENKGKDKKKKKKKKKEKEKEKEKERERLREKEKKKKKRHDTDSEDEEPTRRSRHDSSSSSDDERIKRRHGR